MEDHILGWFIRWVLQQYRRYLEKQIELGNWDSELSGKIDAIHLLLED